MSLVIPFTFTPLTTISSSQVNANFAALQNAANAGPIILAAPTIFYVSPTGADAAGNGLSPNTPAATMNYILGLLASSYNCNVQGVTIQLANGSYNESVLLTGSLPGVQTAGQLVIQGNTGTPSLVSWTGDACFNASNGALATIQGVQMQSSISQCIISQEHSRVLINNIIFGAAGNGSHLLAARTGVIEARGNYTIAGGAQSHARALEAGQIYVDPAPGDYTTYATTIGSPIVTLTGTPAFSVAFAIAANNSTMRFAAAFSGAAAAGNQAQARFNGVINILGQGTSYLPGTPNTGTVSTGGQIG